ncbi:MAG: multiubiquitin domain-containing protein [Sediminibacterium sp.]
MLTQKHGAGHPTGKLTIIIEGNQFNWHDQYITGLQVKELAHLPIDGELYLSIEEPWKDEPISNKDRIDLARPGIESFYLKQKLKYRINDKEFETDRQYIKGAQIRKQGEIPAEDQIFPSIKGPWEDELIKDENWVDLARPGTEHFYSKCVDTKVKIIVNGREKDWLEKSITFKQVVSLAFGNCSDDPKTVYTVTYTHGPKENPEGTMVKGSTVIVKNKMVFNVTATNKS